MYFFLVVGAGVPLLKVTWPKIQFCKVFQILLFWQFFSNLHLLTFS